MGEIVAQAPRLNSYLQQDHRFGSPIGGCFLRHPGGCEAVLRMVSYVASFLISIRLDPASLSRYQIHSLWFHLAPYLTP